MGKITSAQHAFNLVDRVAIFNSTLGGRPVFEGYAFVKKLLDTDNYYRVKFDDGGTYDRFATIRGQNDPVAHLAVLREQARK